MDKDIRAGIVRGYKPASTLYVKRVNGPAHELISVIAQLDKAVLHLLKSSRDLPVLSQGVALHRDELDE